MHTNHTLRFVISSFRPQRRREMIRAFAAVKDGPVITDWQYQPRPLQPEDVELRIVASGV